MSHPATPARPCKFVVVTGGVLSSLGKGIAAAAIGRLLVARGLRVAVIKLDPYLNVDPGTMSPLQHGEVYVADDGTEADLDLGHYERLADARTHRGSGLTAGRAYLNVLQREREGGYLGATVQVIPHITDEIKAAVTRLATPDVDVVIVELGGTIGDIESLPFVEALRQLRADAGREHTLFVHLTLVPYIAAAGELKTKPTQRSVRDLMELGIQPDLLLCRTERPLPPEVRRKIAAFCNVDVADVIEARDVASIYEVPLVYADQGLDRRVADRLGLGHLPADLSRWREMHRRATAPAHGRVRIAVVGKYCDVPDAYKSIKEALAHGGIATDVGVDVQWMDAEAFEPEPALPQAAALLACDALLVPGGFGRRGVEGKIAAIRIAREHGLPFLGICLGLQAAVIEYARHVAGLAGAHTTEIDPDAGYPVVHLMETQRDVTAKGGTMRLGSYPAVLAPDSRVAALYGATAVAERHRHRFEVNNAYRAALEAVGFRCSGTSPDGHLVEFIELPDHPFFVATQAHPELTSRPLAPHPLFRGLVDAARDRRDAAEA